MKYFRMSYEEVVFRRSYITIMLLNKAIPSFKSKDDKDGDASGSSEKGKRDKAGVKHIAPPNQHAAMFFQQFI